MKNFRQNGDFISFTAAATIASGQLVRVGGLFGIAVTGVANGTEGTLAMEGCFTVPKTAGAGTAIAVGGPAYFDVSEAAVGQVNGSTESAANPLCGYAIAAAADGATSAVIRLLG
jgi:predicted RecA/RadA family phage recombinase